MDKQQIISLIKEQMNAGNISGADLMNIAEAGQPNETAYVVAKEEPSRKLIHVLYSIGAIIAIVGVIILLAQNWLELGVLGRIFVTLGISIITYIAGFLFQNSDRRYISQVMFVMSAALAPLGSFVLLSEASVPFDLTAQLLTALALFFIFALALFTAKKNILLLLTIAFGTWLYYEIILKVGEYGYDLADIFKWLTIVLGVSYVLIAYGSRSVWHPIDVHDEKEKRSIQNILYGFGTLAILGPVITMHGIFNLVMIALIFGAFYGSVYLKSRAMLLLGAIFLIAHIIKLTTEYFVDSIGWPIALIGIGFLVIGVGYLTYSLNKKFLSVK